MMKKLLIFGLICMLLGGALQLFLAITAHGQAEQLVYTRHTSRAHIQHMQQQQPYSNQFPQPNTNPFPQYQQPYQQQPTYPPQLQQQFQQPLYNPNQVVACLNNVLSEAILKANNTKDPLYISNATQVLDRCIVPGR